MQKNAKIGFIIGIVILVVIGLVLGSNKLGQGLLSQKGDNSTLSADAKKALKAAKKAAKEDKKFFSKSKKSSTLVPFVPNEQPNEQPIPPLPSPLGRLGIATAGGAVAGIDSGEASFGRYTLSATNSAVRLDALTVLATTTQGVREEDVFQEIWLRVVDGADLGQRQLLQRSNNNRAVAQFIGDGGLLTVRPNEPVTIEVKAIVRERVPWSEAKLTLYADTGPGGSELQIIRVDEDGRTHDAANEIAGNVNGQAIDFADWEQLSLTERMTRMAFTWVGSGDVEPAPAGSGRPPVRRPEQPGTLTVQMVDEESARARQGDQNVAFQSVRFTAVNEPIGVRLLTARIFRDGQPTSAENPHPIAAVRLYEGDTPVRYGGGTITPDGFVRFGAMAGVLFTVNPGESKTITLRADIGVNNEIPARFFKMPLYLNPQDEEIDFLASYSLSADRRLDDQNFTDDFWGDATVLRFLGESLVDDNANAYGGYYIGRSVVEILRPLQGELIISVDPTTPERREIRRNQVDEVNAIDFAHIRLEARNDAMRVRQLTIVNAGTNVVGRTQELVQLIALFDEDNNQLTEYIPFDQNNVARFVSWLANGLTTIPQGQFNVIKIKGFLAPFAFDYVNEPVKLGIYINEEDVQTQPAPTPPLVDILVELVRTNIEVAEIDGRSNTDGVMDTGNIPDAPLGTVIQLRPTGFLNEDQDHPYVAGNEILINGAAQ